MDETYFRKGSFLMDLKIIFKTAAAVFLRTGQ
jgi:lipopolysaccharide/colanic/teichoic acid biosynthesis glycosyltransferase